MPQTTLSARRAVGLMLALAMFLTGVAGHVLAARSSAATAPAATPRPRLALRYGASAASGHVPALAGGPGAIAPSTPAVPAAPAHPAPAPAPAPSGGTPTAVKPCGVTTSPPAWQHVVWIVMENKAAGQIMGSSGAPYLNGLAPKCGHAS